MKILTLHQIMAQNCVFPANYPRCKNRNITEGKKYFSCIPKRDQGVLEYEIWQTELIDITYVKNCEWTCDNFRSTLKHTIAKYMKTMPQRQMVRQLSWFNNALWQLMKKWDAALKINLENQVWKQIN